jgi:ribosomal protein S18 acetylase RimI-like enzyme
MTEPTAPQITLRPATLDDATVMLHITRAAFEQFRGRLDPPTGALDETVEKLRARAFQPDHGAVLAFVGVQPVGALRWEVHPLRLHLYVGRVAVLPAFRHRGIASAMLGWAERHARALGLPAVQFGVRLQSPENIRFYQHLGYRVMEYAYHPSYAQPTFVWMRKDLVPPGAADADHPE